MSLKLVPPAPKPERSKRQEVLDRLAETNHPELLTCPRCGAAEFLETRVGLTRGAKAKPKGGTKALICLHCFVLRHQRVEIT